ncbi:MAG TPA: type II secretion system F family protein [Burkholderiales bacterium]|jgi:general secretion pathway protein F|nr:type II secretion system F family protein [Burkholderiales bacterium]
MKFDALAIDARQQVVALNLDAANAALAAEEVRKQGLSLISLESRGVRLSLARRKRFPATLFSMELMSLLEAGLNLVEALQTLAEKEGYGERQEVLSGLLAAISRGEPFSQAVAGFPQHFSPLYVATVKASERTGSMREALGRYIAYQEELERVRKKIVSASIYPVILMVVGTLVIGFLMFYVVPRFARVYEDMASTLPFFSRLLLGFGNFVGNNALALGLSGILFVTAAAWALSRSEIRAWLNTRLWRIPALGERMKVYQLARLYRTAGMLLNAGIPAVRALDMVRELLAAHLRPSLTRAKTLIEQGQPMSAAMGAAGLATPVAARMMSVGERSGDMGEMFIQIARFHDDEVARFIDWFTRAFEPLLMAVLGLSVGAVVVLMYMPIFELAGSIK